MFARHSSEHIAPIRARQHARQGARFALGREARSVQEVQTSRGGGGRGRSARHFFLAPSCAQGALMQRARALSARTVERLARLPVRDAVHGAPPLLPPTSAPPTRRETPSRGGRAWRGGAGRNLRSDGAARGRGAGARDGRGDGCSPWHSGRLAARCVAPPPPALPPPPPPPASARSRREFARFQTSAPDAPKTRPVSKRIQSRTHRRNVKHEV